MMNHRRQLILAHGICEYDATLSALEAVQRASRAIHEADTRSTVVVPFTVLSRLRIELRLLLERWDMEFPNTPPHIGVAADDLQARAGLVRAWLTEHVEELDGLLAELGEGVST